MKKIEFMTEVELENYMRILAKSMEATTTMLDIEKPLFVLLIFNDPKVAQYISNCQREDTVAALRETANRLEKKQTVERTSFGDT